VTRRGGDKVTSPCLPLRLYLADGCLNTKDECVPALGQRGCLDDEAHHRSDAIRDGVVGVKPRCLRILAVGDQRTLLAGSIGQLLLVRRLQ